MTDPVRLLPHVPPFLFVDEVLRLDTTRREIDATRLVPLDEPWTAAHLPGRPLVPGVILIEGLAQTCGILARELLAAGRPGPLMGVLASVRSARFTRTVVPGSRLTYHGHLNARVGGLCLFSAAATVEGVRVVEAEIALSLPLL